MVDLMGVDDDHALAGLTEDFRQPDYRHHIRINHIPEHIARAHGRQLIGVAHQHQPRARPQRPQQRAHQKDIHHGHLVHDNHLCVQRIVLVPGKALPLAAVFQQAMNRPRLAAGRLAHALRGAARRRTEFHLSQLAHQADDAVDGGCLAGAGTAGNHRNALQRSGKHGIPLLGAQLHALLALIFLDLTDQLIPANLRRHDGIALPDQPLCHVALGLMGSRKIHRPLAVDLLDDQAPVNIQSSEHVFHDLRTRAQHALRLIAQLRLGQIHMPHAVDRLGQHILNAAAQAELGFLGKAQRRRNLVRSLEAHAVDLVHQTVRIRPQHALGHVAVGLVDLHRQRRRKPVALQKHQRAAHFILLGKGLCDHFGALLADALDLRQPLGLALHNVQRSRAELPHDQLRRRRADALDQAGGQIFFHRRLRLRAGGLVPHHSDLLAVLAVLHQFALEDGVLAGGKKRHNAHGAGAP